MLLSRSSRKRRKARQGNQQGARGELRGEYSLAFMGLHPFAGKPSERDWLLQIALQGAVALNETHRRDDGDTWKRSLGCRASSNGS